MKNGLLLICLCLSGLGAYLPAEAQSTNAPKSSSSATNSPVTAEFKILEDKIRAKLRQGIKTEQGLSAELKGIDALLEKYKSQKTDEVAEVLLAKAQLYLQVFDDTTAGAEIIQKLQRDFPETRQGRASFMMLEAINQQEASKRIQGALVAGIAFPAFDEKDLQGKPLTVSGFRGNVVLIDFWKADSETWLKMMPLLIQLNEKYQAKGLRILGVALDENLRTINEFVKEKNLNWQHFADGQGWKNKLAAKCGVHRLPANFLLDGEGKIIAKNLSARDLEAAVVKALGK